MNNKNEAFEIDINRILGELLKRIWIIVAIAILGACIAFAYSSLYVTPLYESSVMMFVNNSSISLGSTSVSISAAQLNASSDLVSTYIVILRARSTLEDVIDQAGLNLTYGQLSGMISAQPVNETAIFRVTVTSPDPKEAQIIANTIAVVLPERIAEVVNGTTAEVVDYAIVPTSKVSPNNMKYATVGAAIGLAATCAVIALLTILDTTIHDSDYIANTYGIPVLATIPSFNSRKKSYYYYKKNDSYYKKNRYTYEE